MQRRNRLWGILFGCFLFAFTAYVLLDTFVIVRRYETVTAADAVGDRSEAVQIVSIEAAAEPAVTETPAATEAPAETSLDLQTGESSSGAVSTASRSSSAVVSTDTTYRDDNISITLTTYRISGTTVYAADVAVSSPEYLKTAFADNSYGRNITATVSDMAEDVNAILAINGDYYGARQSGYVIRSGVIYRSKAAKDAEDLVIYRDGSFGIIRESEITAEELVSSGAWDVLNFGPALVEDGELSVSVNDEVSRAKSSNPRTAIGITEDGHYLFVVADGRTNASEGLSLYELATLMKTLGAVTAYNLDGGGSSTMVFGGELINNPTSGGRTGERSVSDIVYIGY